MIFFQIFLQTAQLNNKNNIPNPYYCIHPVNAIHIVRYTCGRLVGGYVYACVSE